MQVKEKLNDGLKRAYVCTVSAADIDAAVEAELKKLGKSAKIAGFRPGHVPTKILQQRYGKSVQGDVLRNMITENVAKIVGDKKLRPAMSPKLDSESYEEGQDLKFSFSLETMPDVPEVD